MVLLIYIVCDGILITLHYTGILIHRTDATGFVGFNIVRIVTKCIEGTMQITLFIWTMKVFIKMKYALKENLLLTDLKR